MIISNSSPLIVIGKIEELKLLRVLYKEVKIPKAVYAEVVEKGKEKNEIDAFLVEEAINERWIKVEDLTSREIKDAEQLHEKFGLSKGEGEAIILTQRFKQSTLLLDDSDARKIAKARGIKLSDTLIVPLEALVRKEISYSEFKQIFSKIIEFMKPKSGKVFKILEEAEKWRKQN